MKKIDRPEKKAPSVPAILGAVTGISVLLYLIMLGPFIYVYESLPEPLQEGVAVAYAPLEVLDGKLPGSPIRRYAELWMR